MKKNEDMQDRASTVTASGNEKLLGLEVIRFLSAFSVLIWHYQHFFYVSYKPSADYIVNDQPFYLLLAPFYQAGYYGVNIFWCISGFIFFWKYREIISRHKITSKSFFVLRFSRLYPLHIATLISTAMLQILYFNKMGYYFVYPNNDLNHFILQLFFASNWGLQEGYSFNGPIWSISVEVLIYIIFFTTLRFLGKSLWVAVVAIAIAGAAKAMKLESPIFDCLGFFYIGGMACVARNYVARTSVARPIRVLAWFLIVTLPVTAIAIGAFNIRHFSYLFWLSFTPILLFVAAGDFNLKGRARSFVEAAGNMTYSSYLIHFPLQLSIAGALAWLGWRIPVDSAFFLVGFVVTTLILSYFIYEVFEMPAQRRIRARFK